MPRRFLVLPIVLASLIVLNLAEFQTIESSRSASWQAIDPSSTGDLVELGLKNTNVQGWYSAYVEIAEVAPAADVVLPVGAAFSQERVIASLYGYGGANSVERLPYDFDIVDPADALSARGQQILQQPWDPALVSEGLGRTGFDRWVLARSEPGVAEGILLITFEISIDGDEYLAFVDSRLVSESFGWGG